MTHRVRVALICIGGGQLLEGVPPPPLATLTANSPQKCVSSSVKGSVCSDIVVPIRAMNSWAVSSWPGLQHRKWLSSPSKPDISRENDWVPYQSQHTGSTPSRTKTLVSVFWLPSSSCLLFMVPTEPWRRWWRCLTSGWALCCSQHSPVRSLCVNCGPLHGQASLPRLRWEHVWEDTAHVWMTFGLVCCTQRPRGLSKWGEIRRRCGMWWKTLCNSESQEHEARGYSVLGCPLLFRDFWGQSGVWKMRGGGVGARTF